MRTVGAHEARTHFSRLLADAARGETITITKRGIPVAILLPPVSADSPEIDATMNWMRGFRKGIRLDGVTIRELIDAGRR
jgi:prevent-host-death family protein